MGISLWVEVLVPVRHTHERIGLRDQPTRVRASVPLFSPSVATAVAAGGFHTCAIISGGTIHCWGNNGEGQLGDGSTDPRNIPVAVSGLAGVAAVSAGAYHSCALLTVGSVKCWGSGSPVLGDGTSNSSTTPVTIFGLTSASQIAVGSYHTCALLAGGNLKCWGGATGGASGVSSSIKVMGLEHGVTAIAASFEHTCALLTGGTIQCWGDNSFGQLGDGSTTASSSPIQVPSLTQAIDLEAGYQNTCALLVDGTVQCWGGNGSGQLGDGTNTNSSTPVAVKDSSGAGSLTGVTAIAAGVYHTCALLAGGAMRCWGSNEGGQLGDGTHTQRVHRRYSPSHRQDSP